MGSPKVRKVGKVRKPEKGLCKTCESIEFQVKTVVVFKSPRFRFSNYACFFT